MQPLGHIAGMAASVISSSLSPSSFRSSAASFGSPFLLAFWFPVAVRDSERLSVASEDARCSFAGSSWERTFDSTVETRDIIVSAQAAGTIQPDTTVEVKSRASGEVRLANIAPEQIGG